MPLTGTYTLMMVDPDIPPAVPGNPTGELLHWLQPGLISASTPSTLAGRTVYTLTNPSNVSALATYLQPTPPFKVPYSHRYVELLLNTTAVDTKNGSVLQMASSGARTPFDAVKVLRDAGVVIVASNWFNVTKANATASATASATSKPSMVTTSGAGVLGLSAWVVSGVVGAAGLMML
jgi:hypothetical protein